ncbi:MAG: glycosyltransferase family 39 protein [Verrucomicrobia bacterium]|nr:glycosyltransferase family 39 protein [Verrucomicrobiota bacterium]
MKVRQVQFFVLAAVIVALGFYLRSAGEFRGLESGHVFHPDAAKQVLALSNYLNDRYVFYADSWFYDGYPYGLNHVDEWILRPVFALRSAIHRHLNTGTPALGTPDRSELFYWARALRVLYGMLVLVLAFFISRRLFDRQGAALATALLFALSPLACTVTHFATGDIGVDLFIAGMLLTMCFYVRRPRAVWIFVSGLLCGLAFAAKYQGALGFFVIAAFLLLEWRLLTRNAFLLFKRSALAGAGLLAGVLMATPAYFINPKRTWHDTRINFSLIKNYGVDGEFLSKPFFEKAWFGLSHNTPRVLDSLGWIVLILCAAAFLRLTVALVRKRRMLSEDGEQGPRLILTWCVLAFPLLVILMSVSLKPAVQPFHFSYIQLPVCVGAVYALRGFVFNGKRFGSLAAFVLFLFAVMEFGSAAVKEQFFWSREDTQEVAYSFAHHVFHQPTTATDRGSTSTAVKYFYLEENDLAVFRNQPYRVLRHDADFWNSVAVTPVPSIPFPEEHDWIFMNGPVFPRNDRMFKLSQGSRNGKQLVFYEHPPELTIGLRSSARPVEVHANIGGAKFTEQLDPNEQKVLTVTPRRWKRFRAAGPDGKEVFIVPLTADVKIGECWVTVMQTDEEVAAFRLYGGDCPERSFPLAEAWTETEAATRMDEIAFLHSSDTDNALVSTGRVSLLQHDIELPAGEYIFDCTVAVDGERGSLTFELVDPHGIVTKWTPSNLDAYLYGAAWKKNWKIDWAKPESFDLTAGVQTMRYRFAKPFAPYAVNIKIAAGGDNCRILGWNLRPDSELLLKQISAYRTDGTVPSWCVRSLSAGWENERVVNGVSFPGALKLTGCSFPEQIKSGAPLRYSFSFDIADCDIRNYEEQVVFVHLLDKDGKKVATFDYPIQFTRIGSSPTPLIEAIAPADLQPGTYDLEVGVYNVRTRIRLPVILSEDAPFNAQQHAVQLQKVIVTSP